MEVTALGTNGVSQKKDEQKKEQAAPEVPHPSPPPLKGLLLVPCIGCPQLLHSRPTYEALQ